MQLAPRRDPWWQSALDVLLPPRCVGCGRRGADVCESCRSGLVPFGADVCPRCSIPSTGGKICARCQEQPRAVRTLLAAYPYEGVIRNAIHAFKYRAQTRLDYVLATALTLPLTTRPLTVDLVMPVPLSAQRQRARGFNQSELLARPLAAASGWALDTRTLVRARDTQPQVDLAPRERRHNVDGAFAVTAPRQVAGCRVLLIDDVSTTGATLDACARPLLEAGAAGVWALVIARALPERHEA